MDNLVAALKELQKERSLLEQELIDKRKLRNQLEKNCDTERENCSNLQHKHVQLSDSLTVAQQKLAHTEAISLGLQEDINKCMSKVNSLQQILESQKEIQINAIHDFETALGKISTDLFQAKQCYRKSSLNNAINETMKEMTIQQELVDADIKELQDLSVALEMLKTKELQCRHSSGHLENILLLCLRLLQKDKAEAESTLNSIRNEY